MDVTRYSENLYAYVKVHMHTVPYTLARIVIIHSVIFEYKTIQTS